MKRISLLILLMTGIAFAQNIKQVLLPGTIACMSGVQVEILEFLPEGVQKGDSPRYHVKIVGTCDTAYPYVESVEITDDCTRLDDNESCE